MHFIAILKLIAVYCIYESLKWTTQNMGQQVVLYCLLVEYLVVSFVSFNRPFIYFKNLQAGSVAGYQKMNNIESVFPKLVRMFFSAFVRCASAVLIEMPNSSATWLSG